MYRPDPRDAFWAPPGRSGRVFRSSGFRIADRRASDAWRFAWVSIRNPPPSFRRLDAIGGDELRRLRVVRRHARRRHGFALRLARGDLVVKIEQLLEQVFLRGEAVGFQHRGVERGVRILQRMLTGEFERPVNGAEAALDLAEGLIAHARNQSGKWLEQGTTML